MKVVTLEELRNRLRSYLREVRNGEVVFVTDRGDVVAELRKPGSGYLLDAQDGTLERRSAAGTVAVWLPQDSRAWRPSPLRRAVTSADLLDAERGDR